MWFVTWDRPEYREWALADERGYQLVIACAEADGQFLCVKARLDRQPRGMPAFVTEREERFSTRERAEEAIAGWKAG
jgi:hypothetical protein